MSAEEPEINKKRMTININEIYCKLIENLVGILGESKSSVVYHIIKEWVSLNTKKIREEWNVNLASIREQYFAEIKGLDIKKECNKLEEDIIKELPNIFKNVKSIKTEVLSEILNTKSIVINKILLLHQSELKNAGLNLFIDQDNIYNQNF